MTSRITSLSRILSRKFSVEFSQIHQRNHYPQQLYSLTKCISSIIRLKNWNFSLVRGLHNGCCVSMHENNINVVHLRQSSWVTMCIFSEQYCFENVFVWAVGLNIRLKIFSKPCCKQMCCLPGFVVPFIEHEQSIFVIILKGPRIFQHSKMSTGFNF